MDKQKQIEEMAKDLHSTHAVSAICSGKDCNHCKHATLKRFDDYTCIDLELAESLFNAGYRKIPENAVVLTREEFEVYEFVKKKHASNEEVRSSEIVQGILHHIKTVRKETAEKFAERLKASETIKDIAENGYIVSYVELCKTIDEIAKEIIEGDAQK